MIQQKKLSTISTNYSHLFVTNKKNYFVTYAIFEHEIKLYDIQWQRIQKLIDYIYWIVASTYIENCCDSKYDLDIWFVNFKKMTATFTTQEFINIRKWYTKTIQFLTKIKNYDKWIIEWESALYYMQIKKVESAMRSMKWIENFFSAIDQILSH